METNSTVAPADFVRKQLIEFLRGGSAHVDAKTALAGVPPEHFGVKVNGLPHTLWQLLQHTRFTLHDLLNFCTNAEYVAPEWPEDYWPPSHAPRDPAEWKDAAEALLQDLAAFEALIENPETDLGAPIHWGQGQTILREALLAVTHTSYHLGQIVLVRQALGDWKH